VTFDVRPVNPGWSVERDGRRVAVHYRKWAAVRHATGLAEEDVPSRLVMRRAGGRFEREWTFD
jgi:Uncharacterized protein conserved in bacteria (DUF2188)